MEREACISVWETGWGDPRGPSLPVSAYGMFSVERKHYGSPFQLCYLTLGLMLQVLVDSVSIYSGVVKEKGVWMIQGNGCFFVSWGKGATKVACHK